MRICKKKNLWKVHCTYCANFVYTRTKLFTFYLVCSSVIWLVFYWLSWNRKIYLWCGKREEVRWCYYCWNQRKLPRKMQLFFPPLVKLFFCSRCSFTIFPKLNLQDSVKVAKITVQNTICSNNGFEKSFALFVHCEQNYSMKAVKKNLKYFLRRKKNWCGFSNHIFARFDVPYLLFLFTMLAIFPETQKSKKSKVLCQYKSCVFSAFFCCWFSLCFFGLWCLCTSFYRLCLFRNFLALPLFFLL